MAFATTTRAVFLSMMMLMAALHLTMAVVHNVGDDAGWRLGFDYQQWANAIGFNVGDSLVFTYSPSMHYVMQVSAEDFNTCNTDATPIALYTSGNDSVALNTTGHFYFFCGVGEHCKNNMKVDINVPA